MYGKIFTESAHRKAFRKDGGAVRLESCRDAVNNTKNMQKADDSRELFVHLCFVKNLFLDAERSLLGLLADIIHGIYLYVLKQYLKVQVRLFRKLGN